MADTVKAEITQLLAGHTAITEELYMSVSDLGYSTSPKLNSVTCTCSAGDPRCVHILAVYYEISRQVDNDPVVSLIAQGCIGSGTPSGQIDGHPATQDTTAQRWIPLDRLDRNRYFAVGSTKVPV
jgi:hypothetical protein